MSLVRSSGRRAAIATVATGLAALGAFAPAVAPAGPVQIVSQERRIEAEINLREAEIRGAVDVGPFRETAGSRFVEEGFRNEAVATIDSTLDPDRFTLDGTLSYDVQDTRPDGGFGAPLRASATLDASVVFSLDEAYRYTLRYDLDETDNDPDASVESAFEFVGFDGGSVDETVAEGQTVSGVLEPGSYRLALPVRIANTVADEQLRSFDLDYGLSLDLEPVDGVDGGTPIPLPPAVWSGIALMGAGLLNRWRRARHAV